MQANILYGIVKSELIVHPIPEDALELQSLCVPEMEMEKQQ